MKIVNSATSIQIDQTVFPINSLFVKKGGDNDTVLVFMKGLTSPIISSSYRNFTDSGNGTYSSIDAVVTDIKSSIKAPTVPTPTPVWPALTTLGTIVNEDYTTNASLVNYQQTKPNSTWAVSGGFLNTVNSAGSALGADHVDFNNYLSGSYTTLDRWTQTAIFFVRTIGASSTGFVMGIKDYQANGDDQYWCFVNCLTGLTGIMAMYYNGATAVSDLTVRTILANDKLIASMTRSYNTISFTVQNVTQGWTNTITYSSNTMTNTAIGTPSMGEWSLSNRGGTFDIQSMTVTSPVQKNVDYCFIGHSIPAGYNATLESLSWPSIAGAIVAKPFTKMCSQSNYLADMLHVLNEVLTINAKTYIMMDARNDIAVGRTAVQWKASYDTWITALKANGSRVILPYAIPGSVDVRPFNTYVDTKGEIVMDLFNGSLLTGSFSMVSHYLGDTTDDTTHPGVHGHNYIGTQAAQCITANG